MATNRKPYDLLMLMTIEFLLVVLTFYTAVIMAMLTALSDDAVLLENIDGASQFLIDNARDVTLLFAVLFGFLAFVMAILLWGFLRHKRWSYRVGIETSIILVIGNIITIILFGFGDLQLALRLGLSIVLPFIVIYYLRRPEIKKYLLG
jgi:hypothetical protein